MVFGNCRVESNGLFWRCRGIAAAWAPVPTGAGSSFTISCLFRSKVKVPTSVRSLSCRITARLLSALNEFLRGKGPFCLFLTTSDTYSLTNNGGLLPFRFLARDMTRSRSLNDKNLTMTVFFQVDAHVQFRLLSSFLCCVVECPFPALSIHTPPRSPSHPVEVRKSNYFCDSGFLGCPVWIPVCRRENAAVHDFTGDLGSSRTEHQRR